MTKLVNKVVTVKAKTSNHIYSNIGSAKGYFINGVESPSLNFLSGFTYCAQSTSFIVYKVLFFLFRH